MARLTKQLSRWFEVKDDSDKAALEIRRLKPGELAEIDSIANEVTVKAGRDGQPETEIILNTRRRQLLTVDRCIIGMRNFYDTKGKQLPCTTATKQSAMLEFDWFWPMVEEALETLEAEFEAEEKKAAKNS